MRWIIVTMLVFSLMFTVALAHAENAEIGKPAEGSWEFEVIPYLWMSGISGDVKFKGREAHLDTGFSDIFENLDFGGQMHIEARKEKWGFFFDGTYLKLSQEDETINSVIAGPTNGNVSLEEWLVEMGASYKVAGWSFRGAHNAQLVLLGGGRFWYMKSELSIYNPELERFRGGSKSDDWVDPFVGIGFKVDFGANFLLAARGDIGGFGVGSDFSWNVMGFLGYQVTRSITAYAGYRALGLDYVNEDGDGTIEYDLTMYGPMVGVGFIF